MTASAATPSWTLAGHRGTCRLGPCAASIDLDDPVSGLAVRSSPHAADADQLLGLDLGSRCLPDDHWLRGPDITATYEPNDARQLRATAMWRQQACTGDIAAWQLIASAQTSLLDSDPAVSVVTRIVADDSSYLVRSPAAASWSRLRADELPTSDATALLVLRPKAAAVLVAAHPSDAPHLAASWAEGRLQLVCRLFTQQLEKGVLLRSRVLAALGPSGDTTWADRLLAEFHAAQPPLTT